MNKCEKCGFLHYRTDPCREPKVSVGSVSVRSTDEGPQALPASTVHLSTEGQSTAARKDVHLGPERVTGTALVMRRAMGEMGAESPSVIEGTQLLPVDTNKGVAHQPVEQRSPKPPVASSNLAAFAKSRPVPDRASDTVGAGRRLDSQEDRDSAAPESHGPKFDKKAWMREYMREYMRRWRAAKGEK